MNMIGRPFLMTVLASVFVLGALDAQAQECSNASYQGVYGFTETGITGDGLPIAIVGRFTADGDGNIVGSQTNVVNGVVDRQTYTETYAVNADCTGSSTKVTSSGATLHFDFVILHGGRKIRSIQTDRAVVTLIADRDSVEND